MPALLLHKYLGEVLREEGRLRAAPGEVGSKGGPVLVALGREELAGTARGLLARAGRLGELDRAEQPEGLGEGEATAPPGWVTV